VNGPLLGARLDLAILDDVVSFENSFTAGQREKVVAWFRSTLVGGVVATGRVVVVGNPWHADDLLHVLERSGEYQAIRDPAMDATGEPLWPEAWSRARLEQLEFSRQMLLEVLSDAGARFRQEWLERAFAAAVQQRAELVDNYNGPMRTFTGVDLGVGATTAHDESVLFTIALLPDGRRQVLSIEAGRWQAPELVARIKSARSRFRSRVRVESNAAQAYIVQFLAGDGVHVESHTTGRNRHDPILGIESLAVELEQGRWIVPDSTETRTWAREMLAFSPMSHPGDRLVASWLAREAARDFEGLPQARPMLGESEVYANEDENDWWVLGPMPARPESMIGQASSMPSACSSRPWIPPKRERPFIIR
jgi:hypothetical protein